MVETYTRMEKLIKNTVNKHTAGALSDADFEAKKEELHNKLDTFRVCDRLTDEEYKALHEQLSTDE